MADISIFQDEAFSVPNLAVAISETPFVPGRIGAMGLFSEEGIPTTSVEIEYDGQTIGLVHAKPRGAPPQAVVLAGRRKIPFSTIHLPQTSTMMADEIQNIRAFGQQSELEVAQARVAKYQAKHRLQLDMTHEYQRMGAIKGLILDADGQTVLLDIYRAFGIEQLVYSFDLDNAATLVRTKADEVLDMMEDELGAMPSTGARAICGKNFWRDLINHKSVRETYLNTAKAAELLGKTPDSFDVGGITFERYRGKLGGQPYVADDEAYVFPTGVPDLMITRFAPGDYLDTVNTDGLPYYTRVEALRMGKGLEIESQSNPLHVVTRPRVIIRLTRTAA